MGPILKVLFVKDCYIFHPLNRGEKQSKIYCGVQICKLCFINFILMGISLSYNFCTRFCGNSKISDITKNGPFQCISTNYQMYLIFAKKLIFSFLKCSAELYLSIHMYTIIFGQIHTSIKQDDRI